MIEIKDCLDDALHTQGAQRTISISNGRRKLCDLIEEVKESEWEGIENQIIKGLEDDYS
ncbi:MAG: hypothetical protein ACFFDN_02420 [Candidatus Hodarchaeota archaeon]